MAGAADADLLVLLHGAVGRTTTLTGELRTWSHASRSQKAFQSARNVSMGGNMVHYTRRSDGVEESEAVWSVVQGPGGCYRWDQLSQEGSGVGVIPLGTQGCDGERAWFVGHDAVYVNRAHANMMESRLLDPTWLLTHDLEIIDESEVNGRAVLNVRASTRETRQRSGGAADWAAERDIVVDAERGFLHRDTALVEGEPYDVMELRALVVDAAVDPAVFEPDVPPGMKVVDHTHDPPLPGPWDRRRRWHFHWPVTRW
jgi:outer membrane lipoprotein-sorting protein